MACVCYTRGNVIYTIQGDPAEPASLKETYCATRGFSRCITRRQGKPAEASVKGGKQCRAQEMIFYPPNIFLKGKT